MRALAAGLVLTILTGCGGFSGIGSGNSARNAESENDLPFKASLSKGEDPRDIVVSVTAGGEVTLDDVRESVRFEATKYCLLTFGSSDADWQIDPATGDWAFTQTGNVLVFSARCAGR